MIAGRGRLAWVFGLLMLVGVGASGGCANYSMLSTAQEVRLGEESAPQFVRQAGGEVPDEGIQRYVSSLGRRIVDQIKSKKRRELPWKFFVLNSPVVNAFALPGGKIFITRGLMEKMHNEAQLAGVLGHEVGHVVAQHVGERMTQQLGLQVGLGVLGVATDQQWVSTLGGLGGNLYLLKFGRGQETEADQYGLQYMVDLGYDPKGMIGLQQVLMEASGGGSPPEFLSTHPHPQTRIEHARKLIDSEYSFTRNNPKYVYQPDAYQRNVLEPLSRLPPAKPPEQSQSQPQRR